MNYLYVIIADIQNVEIEYSDYGHLTYGEIDRVIPIVYRISKFIRKNLP